ncbi:unnamed protein product, partial [Larinioides sclopetarius]
IFLQTCFKFHEIKPFTYCLCSLSSLSWLPWLCAPWLSGPTTMATTITDILEDMLQPPMLAATTEPQPTTTGGRSRQLLLRTQEK